MRTIFKALSEVQSDLAAIGIGKDQRNEFDKYNFRGIDDVLNALAPILANRGVLIIPSVVKDETRTVPTKSGGIQYHTKVKVKYTMYDSEGDSITHKAVGEAMDRGDKSINKAMTASFKYFIFQAFCIPLVGQDADKDTHEIVQEAPVETREMVEAGAQLNQCLEIDDYHGAAQIYAEWSHEENLIICRAPSKGGELSSANRAKLKSTEFRLAFNEARGITTESAA